MLSRNQVKHIHSLKQKKFREIHRQFLAEGSKLVLEILESPYKVIAVYALADWLKSNENILLSKKVPFTEISEGEMERITALSSPSPALAIVEIPATSILPATAIHDLVLVLDDIKDPGNLGTIIRIADWFGIESIICSENTVDLYNPKVIQATMGSVTRVRVAYFNLPEFLSSMDPAIKIYGTFPEGENIYSIPLDPKGIILIGSESTGISPEVAYKVTDKISIPSYSPATGRGDHAESLNASIAAAIVCSEFRRRNG
jgi:TrmH family RNA methyltransferase